MFKNLTAYKITNAAELSLSVITPIAPQQRLSVGFAPVCDDSDSLVASCEDGVYVTKFQSQTKVLSHSHIKTAAAAQIKALGKISNKQIKQIRDEVEAKLLPNAPVTVKDTHVIITKEYVLIDASGRSFSEMVLSSLKLGSALRTELLEPAKIDMSDTMTEWVSEQTRLDHLVVGNECNIEGADGQRISIKASPDIIVDAAEAVDSGGRVLRIGLEHSNGLYFVLNDSCQMLSIKGMDKPLTSEDCMSDIVANALIMNEYASEIMDSVLGAFSS